MLQDVTREVYVDRCGSTLYPGELAILISRRLILCDGCARAVRYRLPAQAVLVPTRVGQLKCGQEVD